MGARRSFAWRASWLFYALAAGGVVWIAYELMHLSYAAPGSVDGDIYRSDSISAAVVTALMLLVAEGLRRHHKWAIWLAIGLVCLVFAPDGTLSVAYFGAGIGVGVFMRRRRVPLTIVLPFVFGLITAPVAVFVASGMGTHMSALLLYPFATPWWMVLFINYQPGTEVRLLLLGCMINVLFLCGLGGWLDRRVRRRAAPQTNDASGR